MQFSYQSEKFAAARHALMLPHPKGEAASIASAFHEISLGLHQFDDKHLDDNSRDWVAKLRDLMDSTGLRDPDGRGLYTVKAESLTLEQKFELSRVVDELESWFSASGQ